MSIRNNNSNNGLIFVFDLDETIANTSKPLELNRNILSILFNIVRFRGNGIDGIFLLTNNSDIDYIASIDAILLKLTGSKGKFFGDYDFPEREYFFDYITPITSIFHIFNTKTIY
jgi:hypothetical protein